MYAYISAHSAHWLSLETRRAKYKVMQNNKESKKLLQIQLAGLVNISIHNIASCMTTLGDVISSNAHPTWTLLIANNIFLFH